MNCGKPVFLTFSLISPRAIFVAKWPDIVRDKLLPSKARCVEPAAALKSATEYVHLRVRRTRIVGRVSSLSGWAAVPVHFRIQTIADVNENLDKQLERRALVDLVRFT